MILRSFINNLDNNKPKKKKKNLEELRIMIKVPIQTFNKIFINSIMSQAIRTSNPSSINNRSVAKIIILLSRS